MPLTVNQFRQLILSSSTELLQSTIHTLIGNIQDKENEKNMILAINGLLSNTKTRSTGLELINALIQHFSVDTLLENVTFWLNNCLVQNQIHDNIKEIKLRTMEKIIKNMGRVDSLNKKVVQEYLPETVKACLSCNCNLEKCACLTCLSQCMEKYPSWFGHHQEKVESFLIKYLNNNSISKVRDAADAFHLFNQTGPAGVDGIHYVNNFRNQLKKLCKTVHVLYDAFFENIKEIYNSERIDSTVFTFSSVKANSSFQMFLETITSRIMNCLTFIKIMLMKRFPVEKQIVPKYVLDIINRGLSVHICMSEENPLVCQQSLLLNKIHINLLQLLRVFIIGNHSSLLPFSYVINKVIFNTLKKTNSCLCFMDDLAYRELAYKTLISWLSLSKAVNHSRSQETLIALLLEDIRPVKKKILLSSNVNKKESKQQHSVSSHQGNNSIERTLGTSNVTKEYSCITALDVMKHLFATYPILINQSLLQEVVSFIVRSLSDLQMNKLNAPYTNPVCQLKLYEVLISLIKQERNIGLSVHLIICILHKGTESINYKISEISREGLHLLEKISHPVCNSLSISNYELQFHGQSKTDMTGLKRKYSKEENLKEEISNVNKSLIQEESNSSIEKNNKKEINILSNILISESVTVSSNIAGANVEEGSNAIENINKEINVEETAQIIYEVKTKEEEPPEKKKKDESNTLETMFCSFQDVIQD